MIELSCFRSLISDFLDRKVNPTSVKVATLKSYIKGDRRPSRQVLIETRNSTGKSIDWMIGISDVPQPSEYTAEFEYQLDLSLIKNEKDREKLKKMIHCIELLDGFERENGYKDREIDLADFGKVENGQFYQSRCGKVMKLTGVTASIFTEIVDNSIADKTVYSWFNDASPSIDNVAMLCEFFQVSSDYLMGCSNNPNLQHQPGHELISITNLLTENKVKVYRLFGKLVYREYYKNS